MTYRVSAAARPQVWMMRPASTSSQTPWNAKPMAEPAAIMAMPATSGLRMEIESASAA